MSDGVKTPAVRLLEVAFALALSLVAAGAWIGLAHPFPAVLGASAVALVWGSVRASSARGFLLAGASVLLALALFETGLWLRSVPFRGRGPAGEVDPSRLSQVIPAGPYRGSSLGYVHDPLLGWRMAPDTEITERGHLGRAAPNTDEGLDAAGGIDVDVCYTTGPEGFRRGAAPAPGAPTALFFGDSYQFGLRLDDDETAAALFAARSGGRYAALNLGVPGWGPHQTVALLEHRLERTALAGGRPFLGVYTSVFDAARPVKGHAWGRRGPRYRVDLSGRLRIAGRLEDEPSAWSVLRRSLLFSTIEPALSTSTEAKERLYLELFARARDVFEERYRAPFVVVVAGSLAVERIDALLAALAARGVRAYSLEKDVLPGHDPRYLEYRIAGDGHPNRRANERVAEWLLRLAEDLGVPSSGPIARP